MRSLSRFQIGGGVLLDAGRMDTAWPYALYTAIALARVRDFSFTLATDPKFVEATFIALFQDTSSI